MFEFDDVIHRVVVDVIDVVHDYVTHYDAMLLIDDEVVDFITKIDAIDEADDDEVDVWLIDEVDAIDNDIVDEIEQLVLVRDDEVVERDECDEAQVYVDDELDDHEYVMI